VTTDLDAILDRLAREVLMVDAEGRDLTKQYADVLRDGLPKLEKSNKRAAALRRDVIVVGAGIAGLVAGWLLKRAGCNVTILEANDSRVGGRVKTFHTTPEDGPAFSDPALYAEAGAMRIPTTHPLVNALIDQLGLGKLKQPFYNVDVSPDGKQTFAAWIRVNGLRVRRAAYNNGKLTPGERTLGFRVPERYAEMTANAILAEALAEPNSWITVDKTLPPDKQLEQQIAGWRKIIERFDGSSMLDYLRAYFTGQGISPIDQQSLIAYLGTLQNLTSRLALSFLHSFVDTFYISSSASYIELRGGNWQLPEAFVAELERELVMDARVVEIQWANGDHGEKSEPCAKAVHRGKPGVYARSVNEPVVKRGVARRNRTRFERELTADHMIVTVPFSALRFVSTSPMFSYEKRRAIIELHYDSATKVLLEFSERFWEWSEEEWHRFLPDEYRGHGSIGGGSITDAPNRFIYFPSHPTGDSRGGVVLASYTWADEANRWDSIPAEDRYAAALDGLVDMYGGGIRRFFTGVGRTQSWMEDYYAYGEAAVFTPGQLIALHPHIPTPEGNVHFAGEHTSLKHAWIEGAIESGIRAAIEVHERVAAGAQA